MNVVYTENGLHVLLWIVDSGTARDELDIHVSDSRAHSSKPAGVQLSPRPKSGYKISLVPSHDIRDMTPEEAIVDMQF